MITDNFVIVCLIREQVQWWQQSQILGTWNLELGTWNLELGSLNSEWTLLGF
jgi:hypothetical protein